VSLLPCLPPVFTTACDLFPVCCQLGYSCFGVHSADRTSRFSFSVAGRFSLHSPSSSPQRRSARFLYLSVQARSDFASCLCAWTIFGSRSAFLVSARGFDFHARSTKRSADLNFPLSISACAHRIRFPVKISGCVLPLCVSVSSSVPRRADWPAVLDFRLALPPARAGSCLPH
jgi:hypothetical protein